jgi:ribosome-associated protein
VSLTVTTADIIGPAELVDRVTSALGPTIVIISQDSRSKWQNRQTCRSRLISMLDEASAPPAPPRRTTRPSKGSVERRLAGKRLTAAKKAGRRGEGW